MPEKYDLNKLASTKPYTRIQFSCNLSFSTQLSIKAISLCLDVSALWEKKQDFAVTTP